MHITIPPSFASLLRHGSAWPVAVAKARISPHTATRAAPALRLLASTWLALALGVLANGTQAGTGLAEWPGTDTRGPITVFYPTAEADRSISRGPFTLALAPDAAPRRGNGRLIVMSHGSGGSPWTYADLATTLVTAGYVVAMPEHAGDNWHDHSKIGPESWVLRPREVSATIDAVAADSRFGPLVDARQVGVWGMSAGGHTTLTLAGGRWSRARQLAHCEQHLQTDWAACTGGGFELSGGAFDGAKLAIAARVIRAKLSGDNTEHQHTDARIRAIVSGVPWAADFDLATLARPVAALGLIQAQGDIWLLPRFHSAPVIQACAPRCEVLADLPIGGHGALVSPLPPTEAMGALARLLTDPPGYDRRATQPGLFAAIRAFFDRHLLP